MRKIAKTIGLMLGQILMCGSVIVILLYMAAITATTLTAEAANVADMYQNLFVTWFDSIKVFFGCVMTALLGIVLYRFNV